VPQAVDSDPAKAMLGADALERPEEVPRLDRPAAPGGEYELLLISGSFPVSTCRNALPLLLGMLNF